MSIPTLAAGLIICLCASAFFSATEMAYSSCNDLRLQNMKTEGNRKAKLACYIIDNYDSALSTILIGNNLANIAGSSIASLFMIALLGQARGESLAWLTTLVMTLLVIIFGETIPKILAKKNANRMALTFAPVTKGLMIILTPVVWVVVKLIHLLTLPFKGTRQSNSEEAVEELQNIFETAEDEAVLDGDQTELLKSAIDFSRISVSEVMTARVDVEAIDIDDSFDEIRAVVENTHYSRLPVYEDSIDNVIGILYLNHFLKTMTESSAPDIRSLLMKPIYVYKTMKLPDVLGKLRKEKQHLAVVSDEYGGVLGVVSMEDVLEQIVGDIWDEDDEVEEEVVIRNEGEFEIDGDMSMSDLLELLEIREADFSCDSETVGGWTVESIGDFPKAGDSFTCRNFKVTVLSMDGRRVEQVLIQVKDDE